MTDEMIGYHRVTQSTQAIDDGYKTTIPQNWKQGRTTYGGLTLAHNERSNIHAAIIAPRP